VEGRAHVICTRDTDLDAPEVVAFCRQSGIEVMSYIDLLNRLRGRH
jgi:diketogulonate reductase-like aldo/keto reductase